jgi:hypothetical protein
MTIVRIGNRYINLDNLLYTSDLNSSNVILYFSDKELEITDSKEVQKLYHLFEYLRLKPGGHN